MKTLHLLLLGSACLLFTFSACKKEEKPQPQAIPISSGEPVIPTNITPLDSPLILPAGKTGARRAAETVPIILVHGLFGWGPGELLGFNYWGGLDDIPQYLNDNGFPTYATSVGPVSSNWDRAIELYYYIKGGYVDYGKAHSSKYGHLQKTPRYYPGVYPQWDAQHPIHLLGHSMGGTTVRKLVALLEKGDITEKTQLGHAPLFDGGKTGWVRSITTVSTPHRGATLAYILMDRFAPFVRDMLTSIAALGGMVAGVSDIYDFDLAQWGLSRAPGESFQSYSDRVYNSKIWHTNDYAGYDLAPDPSLEVNKSDITAPGIYYFSVSTRASNTGILTGWEYPRLDMFPIFIPLAFPVPVLMGIGNLERNEPGKVIFDAKWWPNDGVANTYGQDGPDNAVIRTYDPAKPLQKGVWNHLGLYNGYDHIDVIGIGTSIDVRPFYLKIARLLQTVND